MSGGTPTVWGSAEIMGSFFGALKVPPSVTYMALIKDTAPNPYVVGNELDEPLTEAGYSRLQVDNQATNWIQDAETITNNATFTFTAAIADWGEINYWAMCNAPTEGQVYFYGEFLEPVQILAGDFAIIDTGTLSFIMAPSATTP
jgi:hypothetical protein